MATIRKSKATLTALGRKLHQQKEKPDQTTPQKPALERSSSMQVAVRLPADLVDRMRAAAFYTPGETITSLIERGATAEIARLERERGEPFPAASGPVRRGRPVGRA